MNYSTLWNAFKPVQDLTDEQRSAGLRMVLWQAVASSMAGGFASGGFLAAFALALGASNLHIGLLSTIPAIIQPVQIVAVIAVEHLRMRKPISVAAYFIAYGTWVPTALIPFVIDVPHPGAVTLLLVFVGLRGTANAFLNASWNGWLRDLVPQDQLGKFFSNRMRMATIVAAIAGLAAALYIDVWKGAVAEESVIYGYSIAMLFGTIIFGWSAVGFMARVPEPAMLAQEGPRPSIVRMLSAPLKDQNFGRLMKFLAFWNFSTQLAVPFFIVYMLKVLDLPLSLVVGLGVISQASNVMFMRVWGQLVDRFRSKAILSVSSSLYLLVVFCWIFTTMPGRYALTIPLLVTLHLFIGIANAGINISTTTIRMKMAPQAQSTAYLTGASLAANLGAGIGPLVGGIFADFFSVRQLRFGIEWADPSRTVDFPALFLTGYDFLFVVAFILGLITMNLLTRLREEGEVDGSVVLEELNARTRDNLRFLNSLPGMSLATHFPTSYLHVPGALGLDVAAGVAAYQLSASTRGAIMAATRGSAAAADVGGGIADTVSHSVAEAADAGLHGADAALQVSRAAMHTVDEVGIGVSRLAGAVIGGVLRGAHRRAATPFDALTAAVAGTIKGAVDVGESVGAVAIQAIDEARLWANQAGIEERDAVVKAAVVALETVEKVANDSVVAEVKEAILNTLIEERPRSDRS